MTNTVSKQVKVKGDRYLVAMNINYRVENQTVNFTLGNLVISSDTPIYSFSDSRVETLVIPLNFKPTFIDMT